MFLPDSGLFFNTESTADVFVDGDGNAIPLGAIPIYESRARAEEARSRILDAWPDRYRYGRLIVLPVELKFKESATPSKAA
jgi:hypothetical protein